MDLNYYIKKGPSDRNIREWIWGLCKWGKDLQVKAARSFAWHCISIWENHSDHKDWEYAFSSNSIREALLKVDKWLEIPNQKNWKEIEKAKTIAENDLEKAEFALYEASGSAFLVESREKACFAANSIIETCKAALWTEEKAKIGFEHDFRETEALIKSGPALECTEAIVFASKAAQLSIEQIKKILEKSLLDKKSNKSLNSGLGCSSTFLTVFF